MNKGLAIIEVNDTETKGFYIDQEALEFTRLNAKTKKRLANSEAEKREATRNSSKAEKAEARRRAYNIHTLGYVLGRFAAAGAVTWAAWAGLVHPIISIPVTLFCFSAACLRLGAWFERSARNVHP